MRELRGWRPTTATGADDSPAESLSLRVLGHVANLIHSRPQLKEFEIIPVETNNSNKSPVVHTEQNLGLESWCVKHIYNYAYNKLMNEYFPKKNAKKINQNNGDVVDALLMGVLLINPDISTLWNKRKEMVTDNLLNYMDELKFTRIVLSHKHKCNEVFAYRKWLLKRCFSDPDLLSFTMTHLIYDELDVIDHCAERSSNNYHAWSHRIWLIKMIEASDRTSFVYISELFESDKWLSTRISDYSVLHYRQFCIKNLLGVDSLLNNKHKDTLNRFLSSNSPGLDQLLELKNSDEKKVVNSILGSVLDTETVSEKYVKVYNDICLLVYELVINEDICRMYFSHESQWCHRRFVLHQLITLMFEYFGESRPKTNNHSSDLNERHLKQGSSNITSVIKDAREDVGIDRESFGKEPKILRCDNHSIYSSPLYKALISNEKKFIEERFEAGDEFSKRYETWLRLILHLTI